MNSALLTAIRSGSVKWLRGKIENFEENGLRFHPYANDAGKDLTGRASVIEGDTVIMATGYQRPEPEFLPPDCSHKPYSPPNWYLQTFPPK